MGMERGLCLCLLTVALLLTGSWSEAKDEQTTGLRLDVFDRLQEIQELAENNEQDKALKKLRSLQRDKLFNYEMAQTWFLTGYVFYRMEDYTGAMEAYDRVLLSEDIPIGMRQNVLKTLSQLSTMIEDYQRALEYIDELLSISDLMFPDTYALKAQLHYRLEDFDAALKAVNIALNLQQGADAPAKEDWLLLKNAIYYEQDNYQGMLTVLQQLLALYPKDRHVLNLAAVHGELGDSEKQLALMEPLYDMGSLTTPPHLLSLAGLYMMHDIPLKGAQVLEKAISDKTVDTNERNLETLAQAWLLAAENERAISPLRKAAELSEDGNAFVRVARNYMSLADWPEAENSIVTAVEKGGLDDEGDVHLLLGMTRLNQKKFRSARRAFAKAGQFPDTESSSRQWLRYLEMEEEKAAVLDEF